MGIRAVIKVLNAGEVRQSVKIQGDKIVAETAHRVGEDMAREATLLMDQDYILARPYERRRYPGSRRAATAIDYRVEGSKLPIDVFYRVLGGDNVVMRIIILNWGRKGNYPIRPSGNWPLAGRGGASHFKRFKRGKSQGVLAWPGVVTPEVSAGGAQSGTEFLERGMQIAVDRNL
jgi:hypothetical protein